MKNSKVFGREIHLVHRHLGSSLVQQTDNDFFAKLSGQGRYAQVNSLAFETQLTSAVLRSSAIRNIHARDNLQPGDRGILKMFRDFEDILEESIDALTNLQILFFRLDMDVAGPFFCGLTQNEIY